MKESKALIKIFTAQPGRGKTQAAIQDLRPGERCICIVPSVYEKNKLLTPWPYKDIAKIDSEKTLDAIQRTTRARVVVGPGQSKLINYWFMTKAHWKGWAFILNDFPQLFPHARDHQNCAEFLSGIRHRENRCMITTQRVKGVIPPYVRDISDEIIQVGPLIARDQAKILYDMGASAEYATFEEFYLKISVNPDYGHFKIRAN